ncbi:hypothetical protein BN1723_001036 [Verticillium longisporum]|uniref:Uncharacterized protein n=1 Tax=Verticillium longisporum TaxID=100787 RepID=A0A0G4NH09_VERLO|nr:hypothetical protein BN1723_001036 [Verticillium longisporum]
MHNNSLRRLNLELLHALGEAAVLVIALVIRHLADVAALPELPARHLDGLLDLCLFQLGQPLLLLLQAGLLHLAPKIVAPPQKRLGRDGRALKLFVLLALGRHDGLLAAALDGGLAVGNELLGGSTTAAAAAGADEDDDWRAVWRSARQWLTVCLKLYEQQEYEDEKLGEHARQLLEAITKELGPAAENEADEVWEDDSDDEEEDQEMAG